MVLAGALTLLAAVGLRDVFDAASLVGVMALTGTGMIGVGVFPMQTGLPHTLAAMLAFGGVGVSALVTAGTVQGPFGFVSAAVGALELVAFALFVMLRGGTPIGIGGLERWVAYLGVVWAIAFGGHLLPAGDDRD